MGLPHENEYYAYVGRKGPTEEDLMLEIVSTLNFASPDSLEPTVRLTDFFATNERGELADLDDCEHNDMYIHGRLSQWDGSGPSRLIGGIPFTKWSMNETEHGVCVYVAGEHLHFWLVKPWPEYGILFAPVLEKAEGVFWIVANVLEAEKRWGGEFQAFKAANLERLTSMRKHWKLLKTAVPRYFDEDTSTNFWDELVADMLQD